MIDLIHDSVYTDFAAAWSKDIDNMVWFFRTNINKSVSSILKRKQSAFQSTLQKLTDKLDEHAL